MNYLGFSIITIAVGFCMGFYFSDKRKGFSLRDIQLGTIGLILIFVYTILSNPTFSIESLMVVASGALYLVAGLWLGDSSRTKVELSIRREIEKERIEEVIKNFTTQIEKSMIDGILFDEKMIISQEIVSMLPRLHYMADRMNRLGHRDVGIRIGQLTDIFESIVRLNDTIKDDSDQDYEEYVYSLVTCSYVAGKTICYIEDRIEEKLCNVWQTLALAAKTINAR